MSAISLGHIFHANLRNLLGNRCWTKVVNAIATTKSKVKTTATAEYCIDGQAYTKAATDNLFVFTDTTVQPASSTRFYALCLDATGAASVINGTSTTLPDVPSNLCLVGAVKIVTSAAGTFIPGTTLLDAAQVTATYYNLSCAPVAGTP